MQEKEVYTLEEVAQILRVSVRTVRTLVENGEIEAFRVGAQWRVNKDALDRYRRRKP